MAEINLKLLQSFLLVAEHGSFRKAAEAAHRSPSAISMQIKELEDQVGMRLFVRQTKKVRLTPEGQALFEQTEPAMAQINDSFRSLSHVLASRQSTVTIACAPTLAPRQIAQALRQFRNRFPDSTVRLVETTPPEALDLLHSQIAAFYVGPEPQVPVGLIFEPLINDPLLACVPKEFDHGKPSMVFEDLRSAPIIIPEEPAAISALINAIIRRKSLQLNLAFKLQNAFTALSLASAGLGIAQLPSIACKIAEFDGFRIVPFEAPDAIRRIGIVTSQSFVQNGYSERLLGLIRNALRQGAFPTRS